MSYEVRWEPDAEQELVEIWLRVSDDDALAAAANELDRRLAIDPSNEGESRDAGRRVTFEPPLGVLYRVSATKRVVRVLNVWWFASRGG